MKKQYHRLPLTSPLPAFKGEVEEWVPMLYARISKKQAAPSIRFAAMIDTGSPFCLFHAQIGESIGVDIHSGIEQSIAGVVPGVNTPAYFHRLNLHIEANWIVEINAGFIENFQCPALLGRRGFFDRFVVSFDHSVNPPIFEIEQIPVVH
ncbi:MAG: hypothetical protein WBB89_02970 [Candidatus Acidiferrum sp.]